MNLFNNIKSWLKRPLPFFETTKQKFVISIAFGIFILIFLFFFDYYPENESVGIRILKNATYGFITFLVLFFYSYFLPMIMPNYFNLESWNVGRSIVYGIVLVISIGVFNAIFSFEYDNPNSRTIVLPFLFAVVYRTFIISIIPTVIFNFWLERKFYKKYYSGAAKVNKHFKNHPNEKSGFKKISFKAQNSNEKLILSDEELIYIKSEGNYCQIFYQESTTPKKILLRSTLKNMEESLKYSNRILRCHKSYIINLDKVLHVKGNARGYSFIVDGFNYPVPVSRELSKDLLNKIACN